MKENSPDLKVFGIEVYTSSKSPWMRLLFLVVILAFIAFIVVMLRMGFFALIASLKFPTLLQDAVDYLKKLKSG